MLISSLIAFSIKKGIVRHTTFKIAQARGDKIVQRIKIHIANSTEKHLYVLSGREFSLVAMLLPCWATSSQIHSKFDFFFNLY